MSLYREAGRRRRWLVPLVIGLAAGLVIGFGAGRASTDSSPSLERAVAELGQRARKATDALELLTIEYRQAVREGRVVAPTEYAAAQHDVETARDRLAELRPDLDALAPADAQRASEQLDALAALVRRRGPATVVERQANAIRETLVRATGPRR
jgi:hypothetical protein